MPNALDYQSSSQKTPSSPGAGECLPTVFRMGRQEGYFLDKKSEVDGDYFDLYLGNKDENMEAWVMPKVVNHNGLHEQT